jgi:hypothetical protein
VQDYYSERGLNSMEIMAYLREVSGYAWTSELDHAAIDLVHNNKCVAGAGGQVANSGLTLCTKFGP